MDGCEAIIGDRDIGEFIVPGVLVAKTDCLCIRKGRECDPDLCK